MQLTFDLLENRGGQKESLNNTFQTVHCFFEQSGTFRNEFIKLGFRSFDYDIRNDYGETDYIIDLFEEIEKAYKNKRSIFDSISSDDLIFAFFPCTKFSAQILLTFWQEGSQHKNLPIIDKLERDLELQKELTYFYNTITKMAIVVHRKNLKMIIENPYGQQHYLTTHWCLKPSVIDLDRRTRGDKLKKPTQFWFLNIQPKNNVILETIEETDTTNISGMNQVQRSEISPVYANRFIREFIL